MISMFGDSQTSSIKEQRFFTDQLKISVNDQLKQFFKLWFCVFSVENHAAYEILTENVFHWRKEV